MSERMMLYIWLAGVMAIAIFCSVRFILSCARKYLKWFRQFINDDVREQPTMKHIADEFLRVGSDSDYEVVIMLSICMVLTWPVVLVVGMVALTTRYAKLNPLLHSIYFKVCSVLDKRILTFLTKRNRLVVLTTPSLKARELLHPILKGKVGIELEAEGRTLAERFGKSTRDV